MLPPSTYNAWHGLACGADCKDKFLVQCVKLAPGSDAKEVTPDMFDASRQKDIRCPAAAAAAAAGG